MQQLAFLVNMTLKQVFHKDGIKKEQVQALEKNRHWNRFCLCKFKTRQFLIKISSFGGFP